MFSVDLFPNSVLQINPNQHLRYVVHSHGKFDFFLYIQTALKYTMKIGIKYTFLVLFSCGFETAPATKITSMPSL